MMYVCNFRILIVRLIIYILRLHSQNNFYFLVNNKNVHYTSNIPINWLLIFLCTKY